MPRYDLHPSPQRLDPLVLRGRTVRLESLEPRHVPDLARAALSDSHIWDFMPNRVQSGDVSELVNTAIADQAKGLSLAFAVIDLASERAIGSTRYLDYRPIHRGIEIGWTWYDRAFWGTAVNPECKLLLMRHAFETLSCMRVQLKTDAGNLRSRAAIEKLGAKPEGILRKHMIVQGTTLRDSAYFSVLDDEWPAVEAGLQARLAPLAAAPTAAAKG